MKEEELKKIGVEGSDLGAGSGVNRPVVQNTTFARSPQGPLWKQERVADTVCLMGKLIELARRGDMAGIERRCEVVYRSGLHMLADFHGVDVETVAIMVNSLDEIEINL